MIIQACINGNRTTAFHPSVPTTWAAIVSDATDCIRAGAHELHIHIRNDESHETLHPDVVDRTMAALRAACPGTLIGISTGAWIEGDDTKRRDYLRCITVAPDYASVNVNEDDCGAVIETLRENGIGIELGVWTPQDARRALANQWHLQALRVLYEIQPQQADAAMKDLREIEALFVDARVKSVLLHGSDATLWPMIDAAFARGYSTRVGFEDGKHLPDGAQASSNAALVAAALIRQSSARPVDHLS